MASVFSRKGSPYLQIAYFDHTGRRREKSAKTTDRRVAQRIAKHIEDEVALRRSGVIDPRSDGYVKANKQPVQKHIDDYLTASSHAGHADRHVMNKRGHLSALVRGTGASRLPDLDVDRVGQYLRQLKDSGRSARTVNAHRATIIAWQNWLVGVGRIPENRLATIPTLDDRTDRRRQRRSLSDQELTVLIATARQRDVELAEEDRGYCPRWIAYLTAARTGLRRGELEKLTWADIDLDRQCVLIRNGVGKAKRDDLIPLHRQVARALESIRPPHPMPTAPVLWSMPTIKTFRQDLARARETWIEQASTRAERDSREMSDFLRQRDASGRQVDFHALRRSFASALPKANVMPQLAKNLMRHQDMRTTLNSYTDIELRELATAVSGVPDLEGIEVGPTASES